MEIKVDGLEDVIGKIRDLKGRMTNALPAMNVAAADTLSFIDDRFDSSTDTAGRPWQALAESTVARRRNQSSKPLVDTGRLRSSIVSQGKPRSLQFGSNVIYAGTHQFGRGRIPMRSFLPVDKVGGRYELARAGLAGALWRRVLNTIATYLATGELR